MRDSKLHSKKKSANPHANTPTQTQNKCNIIYRHRVEEWVCHVSIVVLRVHKFFMCLFHGCHTILA